jgi:type IV secretion system protein VirB3
LSIMSIAKTELDTHTLFAALTRPAMWAGVPMEGHGLNCMLSVSAFIVQGNLLYGLIFFPLHALLWVACRHDPSFFSNLLRWLGLPVMPNQAYWGVRSYAPF